MTTIYVSDYTDVIDIHALDMDCYVQCFQVFIILPFLLPPLYISVLLLL